MTPFSINLTTTAAALLLGLGTVLMSGCPTGDDEVSESSVSGSFYAGPDDWDEAYEEESDEDEPEGSESSESEATDTTDEDTTETADPVCGWSEADMFYACGFAGMEPSGGSGECPEGLVEGDACSPTGLTRTGCCDTEGNNWYCDAGLVVLEACG